LRPNQRIERTSAGTRRRKPSKAFLRTVKGLLLVSALILGTLMGTFYFTSEPLRKTVSVIVHRDYSPAKAFPGRNEVNVLLLGRDVDRNRHGQVLKTHGRTDTIIVAHLDFANKSANLLSIPRDTYVHIPGRRGVHKINAAHAYGGPELVVDTIDDLLGVRADSYIVVNYDAFIKGIDYLGGLDVNVDKQLDYDDNWGNLHIHLKPGRQHLDGYNCMGFVRYRKSNDGHGDSDVIRIARQQEFVLAAKQALMRPSAMLKLPALLGIVSDNVVSSMDFSQQCSVAYFLKTLPKERIVTKTLASEQGQVLARADQERMIHSLVQEMFYQ
jgi:polyisoprenyl-teichoic acid--peptidoglycan teichoic acid transferase